MISRQEVIEDLKFICAQTNARWLCYDDIHTLNYRKNANAFIREMGHLGYSRRDLLLLHSIEPAYTGGFEIKHEREAALSGYTMCSQKRKNRLVLFYGADTDHDKYTIYHECAHLYQNKYNLFDLTSDRDYEKYLFEVHANTFAAMVILLKAKNVLEYKKCRLGRIANASTIANDKRREALFYVSMPIELALMKEIRKKGRLNAIREFSKGGNLDFDKILFYTKELVEKYAYSQEEFEAMIKQQKVSSHEKLKKRARAYRILGKTYWLHEKLKYRKKQIRHQKINEKREKLAIEKIKRLPILDKKCELINDACMLDILQVHLIRDYDIWGSIETIRKMNENDEIVVSDELKNNQEAIEKAQEILNNMRTIYQKHKSNKFFCRLVAKLDSPEGRDELWRLKEQKKTEIARKNFIPKRQNERY